MDLEIVVTVGLPASGKTFWAKEFIKQHTKYKIVCKDDLRRMLDDSVWTKKNEKFVLEVRDNLVRCAIESGFNVIVADTNLHPSHIARMRQIAGTYDAVPGVSVNVKVKDFTSVPLEECIRRDQGRPDYVGEQVIRRMYNQFLRPDPPKIEYNPDLRTAIICDMDGTLAIFGDANPYDRDFTKDTRNDAVADLVGMMAARVVVILVSGRKDTFRDQTEKWLEDNEILYDHLFMRKGDDNRKDVIVKQEIYEAEIKGKYNVLFVLDDRNQVVEYWRSIGLTCLQVAEGDF